MNITLKFILSLILSSLIFYNMSCKKIKSKKEQEITDPVPAPVQQKLFIPVKLESDNLVIDLKYAVNTAFLIEISNSNGYKSTITYKDQQPLKIQEYKNNRLFYFTDYWITDHKIVNVSSFDVKGIVYTPAGNCTLSYNAEDRLSNIKKYDAKNKLLHESVLSYSEALNISKIIITDPPDQDNAFEYIYDTKNGIFKHINYSRFLFSDLEYNFFFHAVNNCLSASNAKNPQENITYTYQYNTGNYPSQITISKSGSIQTFKISYAELKQ